MSDNRFGFLQSSSDALPLSLRTAENMATLRGFDSSVLPEVGFLDADEIKSIRKHANVSQAVFAKYLNVSLSTIKQWERGEKRPRGTALLLLHLVSKRGIKVLAD